MRCRMLSLGLPVVARQGLLIVHTSHVLLFVYIQIPPKRDLAISALAWTIGHWSLVSWAGLRSL